MVHGTHVEGLFLDPRQNIRNLTCNDDVIIQHLLGLKSMLGEGEQRKHCL